LTGDSRAAARQPLTSFPLGSEVRRRTHSAPHIATARRWLRRSGPRHSDRRMVKRSTWIAAGARAKSPHSGCYASI